MRSYRSELPKDLQRLIASTEEGVERLYRSTDPSILRRKHRRQRDRTYESSSSHSYETENSEAGYERPSLYSNSFSRVDGGSQLSRGEPTPLKPASSKINVISVNSSGVKSSENHSEGSSMRTTFGQRWTNTYRNLITPVTSAQATPDTSPKSGLPPPSVQRTPPPLHPSPAQEGSSSAPLDQREKTKKLEETVEALRDEIREKEKTILEIKLAHANDMAALRESMVTCRSEAAKEVAEQLSVSYAVKQNILKSSLEAESQRVADLEGEVRLLKREKEELKKLVEEKEKELQMHSKATQMGKTNAVVAYEKVAQLEQYIDELKQINNRLTIEIENAKEEREKWLEREAQRDVEVEELKSLLEAQKAEAEGTLAQLENEFHLTSSNYQQLLTDTSERMSQLEKVERKYKNLRKDLSSLKEEKELLVEQHKIQKASLEEECDRLSNELTSTREKLILTEGVIEEMKEEQEKAVAELKRQVEEAHVTGEETANGLSKKLETANHTIELLQSRIDSLEEDVAEEAGRAQSCSDKLIEERHRLTQEVEAQKRKSATFKSQSEDTINTLKRQLKEKDAKLQVLATRSTEPLQRLRQQLEEERGRRAKLEEQFNSYKKKAREAEEKAALELRKEQLRHSTEMAMRTPVTAKNSSMESGTPRAGIDAYRNVNDGVDAVRTPRAQTAVRPVGANRFDLPMRNSMPVPSRLPLRETEHLSPPKVQTTSIGRSPVRSPVPVVDPLNRGRYRSPMSRSDTSVSEVHGTVVDSLSEISRTSPWHSRMEEGDRSSVVPSITAAPPSLSSAPLVSPTSAAHRAPMISPGRDEEEDALVGEQVMYDAAVGPHEQKLNDFHADAAQIFHNIMGSREEFLAQCVSLVKRTGNEYVDKKRRDSDAFEDSETDSST